MIRITIDDKVSPTLRVLMKKFPLAAKHATNDLIQAIHEKAMDNLYSDIKWGSSIGGEKIGDQVRIVEDGNGTILEYFSPHAHIVEHGSIGGLVVRQPGQGPPFAIGKSQGITSIGPRYSFRLQEGKHFLSRAVSEIINSGKAEQIIMRRLMTEIPMLG